ncbi:MAG: OmpA family protein [Prevotella sp.]|jgi:outer membrane protein OmpA-like peptidoglycan-associated protein|nr:OmpA family protein [Prevotella sp.]
MKKLGLLFAAAAMAVSVNAQTVTESKTFDNFYIGINGGAQVKTTGESWMNNLNSNAGLRIGRWFTPVFGLAAEGNVYFNDHCKHFMPQSKTVARYMNVGLIGTVNLSNWFAGYKGEPRLFEVVPVYGFGWGHTFGTDENYNVLTSKAGIDFTFNLGKAKAWQVYVEPSMNWSLNGYGYEGVAYNINKSAFQLNAGIVYKFKNSNGSHNFTIAQLRDQNEIDGLNSQINSLRGDLNDKDAQLSAKDKQIKDLQNALDECNKKPKYVKPATATNLQPTVLFRQGKAVVDNSQMPNIELIAQYMKNHPEAKVEIKGYASPEGNKDFNQALSQKRADAVKNVLVKKYKIAADRLTTKGMGATDKLFKQVEFNRVSTFNDNAAAE